ncbi:hypothetical protein KOY_01304 [Bacillus cereus VDM021]|nr:hypothetical protein IIW_02980 [Bacillus cereus VD136]EOP66928.1 hypothetical protein KOW_01707 [Bacillus cereus VDM006]EOQ03454.1 hypothetical protein KOY_01304 [Bacillus cereus VDM021]
MRQLVYKDLLFFTKCVLPLNFMKNVIYKKENLYAAVNLERIFLTEKDMAIV